MLAKPTSATWVTKDRCSFIDPIVDPPWACDPLRANNPTKDGLWAGDPFSIEGLSNVHKATRQMRKLKRARMTKRMEFPLEKIFSSPSIISLMPEINGFA